MTKQELVQRIADIVNKVALAHQDKRRRKICGCKYPDQLVVFTMEGLPTHDSPSAQDEAECIITLNSRGPIEGIDSDEYRVRSGLDVCSSCAVDAKRLDKVVIEFIETVVSDELELCRGGVTSPRHELGYVPEVMAVLETHESMCLDNKPERVTIAKALDYGAFQDECVEVGSAASKLEENPGTKEVTTLDEWLDANPAVPGNHARWRSSGAVFCGDDTECNGVADTDNFCCACGLQKEID